MGCRWRRRGKLLRNNLDKFMNTIFKEENDHDKELKAFFKSQIMARIRRDECEDDQLYASILMREFKKFKWARSEMEIFVTMLGLISGVFLPFYLLVTLESRDLAGILFAAIWVVAFSYFGNRLKEPRYLMRSKIQAYKELLRDVSKYWYNPK